MEDRPIERYNVTATGAAPGERQERPRERLIRYGAQALSTPELLALLLKTGTEDRSAEGVADLLIAKFHGLRGLANAPVKSISRVKGVGPVKALQIAACVELGRRLSAKIIEQHPIITSPEDVVDLLAPEVGGSKKEHFLSVLLDTKNRVLRVHTVSIGSLDASIVHPREVFKDAVAASAAAVIVAHNHPSGDPTPSKEDKLVTKRLVEAGKLLGIDVLDHLILGDGQWVSLKQLGDM